MSLKNSLAKSMTGLALSLSLLSACASGQRLTKPQTQVVSVQTVDSLSSIKDARTREVLKQKLNDLSERAKKYINYEKNLIEEKKKLLILIKKRVRSIQN